MTQNIITEEQRHSEPETSSSMHKNHKHDQTMHIHSLHMNSYTIKLIQSPYVTVSIYKRSAENNIEKIKEGSNLLNTEWCVLSNSKPPLFIYTLYHILFQYKKNTKSPSLGAVWFTKHLLFALPNIINHACKPPHTPQRSLCQKAEHD